MEMGRGGGESGQRPQGVSQDIQVDLSKGEGETVRQPDEQIKKMLCGTKKKAGMAVLKWLMRLKR